MGNEKRVAIVHDFLLSYGGAERVLQSLMKMYPEAPVYTLLAERGVVARHFPHRDIRESFLAKLPNILKQRHRWLLPLYPAAVEAFDLRDFDLVISSSGAWSKGVVTRLHTKHIAYIHSPMRYAWDENESYLRTLGFFPPFRFFGRILLSYLRLWDKQAAERPDRLIANSEYTRERIEKYYRLSSDVVYPPVAMSTNGLEALRKDYFLLVSRLTEAKKIGVAIEAFNKSELPLCIIGDGPVRRSLEKRARVNIRFLGFQEERFLSRWYGEARALVHIAEEDFGLAMAEALALGTPVIAFDRGGARELVHSGKNGELFFAQTPEILSDGIRRFIAHEALYDRGEMRHAVSRFSEEVFREKIRNSISSVVGDAHD